MQFKQKFRFQSSTAMINEQITTASLLTLLQMATTTTTGQSLVSAVKLRRVSVWGPPAADLIPVTASIEYSVGTNAGNIGSRPQIHSDTSVGSTRVASVSIAPERNSAAAMWQNRNQNTTGTTGAFFILNGPVNSIVDVDVDMVLLNGEVPSGAASTTGATVGVIYCRPLDGASGTIAPLNWPVFP